MLVKGGQFLAAGEALLDLPPGPGDLDQGMQRHRPGRVGAVERVLSPDAGGGAGWTGGSAASSRPGRFGQCRVGGLGERPVVKPRAFRAVAR